MLVSPIYSDAGHELGTRHGAYYQEAISACEFASSGSKKDEAKFQLRDAEAARISGNEVNMLLAIHRAIQALK